MSDAFFRTEMTPPKAPPITERGVVKWLRENLFAGPYNTILTLVALYVLYSLLSNVIPWLLNGVWNANSLQECRDIVAASAGEGATGACWAMIRERWNQFLFGLYPQDLYWRPALALALLLVAIAPVLFSRVPRQLFWLTLFYPAIAFFLLWGGSIWTPIVAMMGFGVMALAYRLLVPLTGVTVAAMLGVLAAVLWWLLLDARLAEMLSTAIPVGLRSVGSDQFGGFLLALVIGVTAISFSLPLGILLALGRQSDLPVIKMLCVGFIEFIRGVPLITLIFTAALLLGYFLPRGTNFDTILRVIILVTFFAAAYLAEVIRGGLAALPRGQYEAADALGLDYWRAQRLIILPQALKISIPGIVSTFIGLFKDTTLVSFVALLDPLRGVTSVVRADLNWKGIYWEPYIFVGAIFFVICFGMSRYSMYLEKKLKTDHR
ncbi:MAG: amino acid ABC transporter permease [Rhodobacteraceae bacterium]|nr:amino acid ABC transporter permease [Paracoccaceae bacterium]